MILASLVAEGDAANQERHGELLVDAVAREVLLDLGGELARRLQDQRARHAGPRAAVLEDGQHRQREGRRLAGAGLGDAQNVFTGKHMRDGLLLDRGGFVVACGGDRGQDLFAEAEFGKGHRGAALLKGAVARSGMTCFNQPRWRDFECLRAGRTVVQCRKRGLESINWLRSARDFAALRCDDAAAAGE